MIMYNCYTIIIVIFGLFRANQIKDFQYIARHTQVDENHFTKTQLIPELVKSSILFIFSVLSKFFCSRGHELTSIF